MAATDHADGNIVDGLRGLVTAVAMNDPVHRIITVLGPIAAAGAWAFVPYLWDTYSKAALTQAPVTPTLAVTVTAVAVIATGFPIWIQLHRQWVLGRLVDERTNEKAELIALLRGYLTPCIENLPSIALGGTDRTAALADVKRAVLNAAQAICGPHNDGGLVRAVRFEVYRQTLVPKDWAGGANKSTRRFGKRPDDVAGLAAWRAAETGQPVLYRDLRKEQPPGYTPGPNSTYQTFIMCGVVGAGGEVYGMLNVDAPQANMLTDVDMMVVGVCAKVLGAAYGLSQPRATV